MENKIKACDNKDKPYSFISYSHNDADKVYPILEELQSNGYRIWYDRHIESGKKWADHISEWLIHENCAKFIVFISKHSVESENVQDEVHLARKNRKSCLVIYLDDVKLSGGLELQLDRWQSIKWYGEPESILVKKMLKGIPTDTIEISYHISGQDSEFHRKYQLLEVIGKGGSSTVYRARMVSTRAIVTVKVANCNSQDGNTQNLMLQNEKNALAKINSPFIPKIIDFGKDCFDKESRIYLVESYIDGETLADIRCPLSESEVVMVIMDVAKILQYLHIDGNNLIHTDIKPANIMIDRFNKVYLIDFGGCIDNNSAVCWGTKTFASPEQSKGLKIDVRSDIYSLGITMKYLLMKDNLQKTGITFKNAVNSKFDNESLTSSYILSLILEKMTDERMEKRFQSLEELIITLDEFQQKLLEKPKLILNRNQYYKKNLFEQRKNLFDNTGEMKTTYNYVEDTLYNRKQIEKLHHSAILDLSVSIPAEEFFDESAQLSPTPSVITVGI